MYPSKFHIFVFNQRELSKKKFLGLGTPCLPLNDLQQKFLVKIFQAGMSPSGYGRGNKCFKKSHNIWLDCSSTLYNSFRSIYTGNFSN